MSHLFLAIGSTPPVISRRALYFLTPGYSTHNDTIMLVVAFNESRTLGLLTGICQLFGY